MARLFLAVPLPEKIKEEIRKVREANAHLQKIVWMKEHNLHLTILFMGHVPNLKTEEVKIAITKVVGSVKPFDLEFESLFIAPSEKPRMLWLKWKRSSRFTDLAAALHKEIELIVSGLKFDHPDPIPHITVARFNSTFPYGEINMTGPSLDRFSIDHCELWESVNTKEGVRYECVERFLFSS